MMAYLIYALLLGMSVASMVTVFRAVWPGKMLAATGRKPWACDICMAFWGTILVGSIYLGASSTAPGLFVFYVCVPSYIVALWLLRQTADIELPADSDDTGEGGKDE